MPISTGWTAAIGYDGSSDVYSTDWTDDDPAVAQAYGHVYFQRQTCSISLVISASTLIGTSSGIEFYTNYDSPNPFGTSGIFTFVTTAPVTLHNGDTYSDSNGNNFTTYNNFSSPSSLFTVIGTHAPAASNGVLTKTSGTGSTTFQLLDWACTDFKQFIQITAKDYGSVGNVADDSIKAIISTLPDTFGLTSSVVANGFGTGWTASFGG